MNSSAYSNREPAVFGLIRSEDAYKKSEHVSRQKAHDFYMPLFLAEIGKSIDEGSTTATVVVDEGDSKYPITSVLHTIKTQGYALVVLNSGTKKSITISWGPK